MARPNRLPAIAKQRKTNVLQMVLDALNRHGTVRGAAADIGVSYQTTWDYVNKHFERHCEYRWTLKPDFVTELIEQIEESKATNANR